jgi:hypothetical protein
LIQVRLRLSPLNAIYALSGFAERFSVLWDIRHFISDEQQARATAIFNGCTVSQVSTNSGKIRAFRHKVKIRKLAMMVQVVSRPVTAHQFRTAQSYLATQA